MKGLLPDAAFLIIGLDGQKAECFEARIVNFVGREANSGLRIYFAAGILVVSEVRIAVDGVKILLFETGHWKFWPQTCENDFACPRSRKKAGKNGTTESSVWRMAEEKAKMRLATFIIVCALLLGQNTKQTEFIPKGVFSEKGTQTYVELLAEVKEPSLMEKAKDPNEQEYRLSVTESLFPGGPYVWRLQIKGDGTGLLIYNELNAVKTNKNHRLILDKNGKMIFEDKPLHKTFGLNKQEVNSLLSLINATDFWNLPVDDKRHGADGESWVIEGVKGGKYHIIARWSPEDGPLKKALDAIRKFTRKKLGFKEE